MVHRGRIFQRRRTCCAYRPSIIIQRLTFASTFTMTSFDIPQKKANGESLFRQLVLDRDPHTLSLRRLLEEANCFFSVRCYTVCVDEVSLLQAANSHPFIKLRSITTATFGASTYKHTLGIVLKPRLPQAHALVIGTLNYCRPSPLVIEAVAQDGHLEALYRVVRRVL